MDDTNNKKWSARKPPLPVDRLRSNELMVNSIVMALVLQIEEVHKVKGKWCHNYTKALFQHVLTKLYSWRPSKKKKKPDTSFVNLSPLHCIARSVVVVVQFVLKVEGQWSNEYNEGLIQFAIAKLRSSSSAPSNNININININNNNNPLALHVATASTS